MASPVRRTSASSQLRISSSMAWSRAITAPADSSDSVLQLTPSVCVHQQQSGQDGHGYRQLRQRATGHTLRLCTVPHS